MSGTGRTRRLKNWERKRRGDAPRAPRRRSHRRGRMSLSQSPAAPRAREGMNVLGSRNTLCTVDILITPNVLIGDCQMTALCASNEQRQVISPRSPRARCCVMGGEARLGVYLSPSTNYERRILEDAFDGYVPRPSPRATSRSIPETNVSCKRKKTLTLPTSASTPHTLPHVSGSKGGTGTWMTRATLVCSGRRAGISAGTACWMEPPRRTGSCWSRR